MLKAFANETAVAEARIIHRIQHENVVRLIDLVEVTGVTLLVLEHVHGGD